MYVNSVNLKNNGRKSSKLMKNINEKMYSLGAKSSIIREIFEYGKKRKAEIGEDRVFDFSIGNPSVPAPSIVNQTLVDLITNTDSVKLHGYTSAAGDLGVRQKIADYINENHGTGASAGDIYMTVGAAASLTVSLNAIINQGDEVIVVAPFFPEYRVFVEKAGGTLRVVNCNFEDFQLDFDQLEKAVNKNTKAIIINSPNNPSGAVLTEETIKKLSELLNKKQMEFGTSIYIISDEPYRELVYGDINVPYIPNYYDNTIVCYSFSKSLSLPGERIGYIFVSPKADGANELFLSVCGAGRALGFVCAPAIFQYMVAECLGKTADITVYKKNRDLLYSALTEYGFEAVHPDGAFYLFVKSPEPDAYAFFERAKKHELLLVPSDDFGVGGYVRISYCVKTEQIEGSLSAFKTLAEEYNLGGKNNG